MNRGLVRFLCRTFSFVQGKSVMIEEDFYLGGINHDTTFSGYHRQP